MQSIRICVHLDIRRDILDHLYCGCHRGCHRVRRWILLLLTTLRREPMHALCRDLVHSSKCDGCFRQVRHCTVILLSQDCTHSSLLGEVRRLGCNAHATDGTSFRSGLCHSFVPGCSTMKFLFGEIKNFCCQSFIGIDIAVLAGIPNVRSNVSNLSSFRYWQALQLAPFGGLCTRPFRVDARSPLTLLAFDVSVSLADELGQYHMKALIAAPCSISGNKKR